jgi:hypothetical protein
MDVRKRILALVISAALLFPLLAGAVAVGNPCDLAAPKGSVDAADVQAAINMALGVQPCTANIAGGVLCNVAVVQRVINAALGGTCLTGPGAVYHAVTLNWVASASSNVAGYNIYRAGVSGGPYTQVNSVTAPATTDVDASIQAGGAYYYVVTAVDSSSNESLPSNEAPATVPSP